MSASDKDTGMRFRKVTSMGSTDTRCGGVRGTSSSIEFQREGVRISSGRGESIDKEGESSGVATPGSAGKGAVRRDDFLLRIGPALRDEWDCARRFSTGRRDKSATSQDDEGVCSNIEIQGNSSNMAGPRTGNAHSAACLH